jgi:hypothetical protein
VRLRASDRPGGHRPKVRRRAAEVHALVWLPVDEDDAGVPAAGEPSAAGLGEIGETLDAEHLARELVKQGRPPAVAGTDLEQALDAP